MSCFQHNVALGFCNWQYWHLKWRCTGCYDNYPLSSIIRVRSNRCFVELSCDGVFAGGLLLSFLGWIGYPSGFFPPVNHIFLKELMEAVDASRPIAFQTDRNEVVISSSDCSTWDQFDGKPIFARFHSSFLSLRGEEIQLVCHKKLWFAFKCPAIAKDELLRDKNQSNVGRLQ